MKASQKSLIRDESGESDIKIILVSIAIALALVAGGLILLVKVTPYLQEKEKTIIDIPEDSPWANGASDFLSDIGWALLIIGILGGILIWLIWDYTQR